MKNKLWITLSIIVLGFTSCKKENQQNPSKPKPQVSFSWKEAIDYSTKDGVVAGGQIIYLNAENTASDGELLKQVNIIMNINNGPDINVYETFVNDRFIGVSTFVTIPNATGANVKYTATVTQGNGESASSSFTFNVASSPIKNLSWDNGKGYVSGNGEANAGSPINIKFDAEAESGTMFIRASLRSYINYNYSALLFDSAFNAKTIAKALNNLPLGNVPAKHTFILLLTLDNGKTIEAQFSLILIQASQTIISKSNIVMGAQSNGTVGSFYNIINEKVMLVAAANSNPESADFFYYYGANDNATLCSPHDVVSPQIFPSIASWKIKNEMLFKKSALTPVDFDNATVQTINNAISIGSFSTKVAQLKINDVLAYTRNIGTNYGLIKISSLNFGASGTITFDMKDVKN